MCKTLRLAAGEAPPCLLPRAPLRRVPPPKEAFQQQAAQGGPQTVAAGLWEGRAGEEAVSRQGRCKAWEGPWHGVEPAAMCQSTIEIEQCQERAGLTAKKTRSTTTTIAAVTTIVVIATCDGPGNARQTV